jgi:hypothetical protein
MIITTVCDTGWISLRSKLSTHLSSVVAALRASQDSAQRKQIVDTKLYQAIADAKRQIGGADHKMTVAMAHAEWLRRQQTFNNEKLNQTLKSRRNQSAQGSQMTKWYATRPEILYKETASCLADVIDAVDMIAEGSLVNPKFNEPFIPPPDTSRANEAQRIQVHYKKESDALAHKFRLGEEERQRAWRRMLKVKGESQLTQSIMSNGRQFSYPVNEGNHLTFPMPSIALATMEAPPRELSAPRAAFPSFAPVHNPRIPEPSAASKHTAARVRARPADDGTVAPICEPRRGPDGLFLRPAGRTRRDMAWDAERGVWFPAESG